MAFDGFVKELAEDDLRLAAVRRQTAVLVHDFNNLLGVILSASEALGQQLPEGSGGRELAELSRDAAERGAGLVRRMLDLTPASTAAEACDAAQAAAAAVRLARQTAPAGVRLEHPAAEAPLPCIVDGHALEAALLNLCVNAGHAMPDGGLIAVAGDAVNLTGPAASRLSLPAGAYVRLTVRDEGVGMSPEVLARATEPYFTTRSGRGGVGLGLSGVLEFARAARGALQLTSEAGMGTTATLFLPGAGTPEPMKRLDPRLC